MKAQITSGKDPNLASRKNDELCLRKVKLHIRLKMFSCTIVVNAGVEGAVVVGKLQSNIILTLATMLTKVKAEIIDPLKVTRAILVDAASVSLLLTTTECIIVVILKDKKEVPGMRDGMAGMDY